MVYPLEDGHPSRYLPGPTCVNFVHATNTANQVVSKLWLAVDSSGGRCPVGHSRELPGWSSPHTQLDWLRRDRDQRRSAAVHCATHDGTCLHRHRRPQLVSSSGRRQRLPATSCRRQPVGVLAFKRSPFAFSALTLLVGRQVGRPACIRRGYLSGARCRLAYGPADATATHCLLLSARPAVTPATLKMAATSIAAW